MPVTSGQLIGRGSLLVRTGSIKQKPDVLAHGFGSALTCAFDAPVQLRSPLLELLQIAPGEQCVSAGVHDPQMPVRLAARLWADCPIWPAEGPDCSARQTCRPRSPYASRSRIAWPANGLSWELTAATASSVPASAGLVCLAKNGTTVPAARPPGGPMVLHPGDASHDVGTAWLVVRRASINGHRRM